MSGISVATIERELNQIWSDEAVGDDGERAVTRACVLTLLVYSDDDSAGPTLRDTLFNVTEQHPCRVLLMIVNPQDPEASSSASVSASCRIQGPRSKQLSCEQVDFFARGAGVKELPSAVAQLLAPDVPVFLWWRSSKEVDDYNLNHFVSMADRVIIDSSRSVNPRRDLVRITSTLKDNPSLSLTDFTWQRLTPWREMFASFYDVADHQPYLARVDRLTIQYVLGERSTDISPRAVFLAAWLAERLGWTFDAGASGVEGEEVVCKFRAGERPITVRFIGVVRAGLEGLISSAKLEATSSPSAAFTVTRAERNRLASEVVLDGRVQTSRVTSYASRSELELLSTELGIVGRDRLYEAAVGIAGQIGAVLTK